MNALDLLKGRKMKVMTDAKVEVELEIEKVEPNQHERVITPDTRENDWWGESVYWNTYMVHFTNGFKKDYDSIKAIEIIEE